MGAAACRIILPDEQSNRAFMTLIRRHWFVFCLLALTASAVLAWFLLPGFGYALISNFERLRAGLYVLETEVDGTPVSYLEGGDGEVVVLLHGFAANKDHWTRVSKYLTPHLRVIAPDLPGFGDSGLVEGGDYSVAAQAARLHEFVRELGLTRFHLGGSSTGGNVAGAYAARYPETVKTLWLVAPLGVLGAEASDTERMVAEGQAPPLIISSPGEYGNVLDLVFEERPWIPRPMRRHLARQAAARFHHYNWIYRQIRTAGPDGRPLPATPLQPLLEDSPIPTLIMWGDRDRVLHVSGAELLAEVMDDARVEIMPGVGHLPMLEVPEETARLYLSFLGIEIPPP
jgi:pimeloyl-ACP methyl ester carboxylesterase